MEVYCSDNVKARELQVDGSYLPMPREEGAPAVDAQEAFMAEAVRDAQSSQSRPTAHGQHRPSPVRSLLSRLFSR